MFFIWEPGLNPNLSPSLLLRPDAARLLHFVTSQSQNLLDKSSVLMVAEGLDVFRIKIPEQLVGRTLAEARVRETTDCTVVALKNGGEMNFDFQESSKGRCANIDVMLGELGISGYFDAIVSGYALASKPDPAVFLRAAERLSVPPRDCIVMEDAVAGVEAARRASMRCIAVASTNPAAALHEADLVVEGWDQLSEASFLRLLSAGSRRVD